MPESREHISCQELVELTSDYIEKALAAEDAELFEQHLNYCAGCERYVDEMLRTIAAGGQAPGEGSAGRDPGAAGAGLSAAEALVIAYKFLRADGTSALHGIPVGPARRRAGRVGRGPGRSLPHRHPRLPGGRSALLGRGQPV